MILDIIVILLLAFSGYMGYKKGLVGILVSVAALILAIGLAFILQGPVSEYLYQETGIGNTLEQSVKDLVEKNVNLEEGQQAKSIPFLEDILSNIPEGQNPVDNASKQLTLYILKGVSFIGILILVFIICYILQMLLNLVFDLPILNSINKVGGVGLNVLKTLVKVWILLAIISFLSSIPLLNSVTDLIGHSTLTKVLYENNLLVTLIESTIKV